MSHAERSEDVLVDIVLEWLTTDTLNDITAEADAIVGVCRDFSGRGQPLRLIVDEPLAERRGLLGISNEEIAQNFLEAAGVGHEIAKCHRLVEGGRDLEIEVVV